MLRVKRGTEMAGRYKAITTFRTARMTASLRCSGSETAGFGAPAPLEYWPSSKTVGPFTTSTEAYCNARAGGPPRRLAQAPRLLRMAFTLAEFVASEGAPEWE